MNVDFDKERFIASSILFLLDIQIVEGLICDRCFSPYHDNYVIKCFGQLTHYYFASTCNDQPMHLFASKD